MRPPKPFLTEGNTIIDTSADEQLLTVLLPGHIWKEDWSIDSDLPPSTYEIVAQVPPALIIRAPRGSPPSSFRVAFNCPCGDFVIHIVVPDV